MIDAQVFDPERCIITTGLNTIIISHKIFRSQHKGIAYIHELVEVGVFL